MNGNALRPLGVELSDVTVDALGDDEVAALRHLLARHGVAVIRGQVSDDDRFLAFLRSFGDLAFTTGETPVADHPDLNVVSNVGRAAPPRSQFHVDTSYVREPPAYTALRAVTIPERGGETVFSDQYQAYRTLPVQLRERLVGRVVTHVATGVVLGDADESSAEHPIFRRHPLSGQTALYLSTPARCAKISGFTDDETREMVGRLLAHSTREDNLYRHRWEPGDVVIWDNGCVLHRADHSQVAGDRVMHRGMVAGYGAAA